jgi:hypothetical protein
MLELEEIAGRVYITVAVFRLVTALQLSVAHG